MAYSREGVSLQPLTLSKTEEIRHPTGCDRSKEIADGAGMDDLDPAAIHHARKLLVQHEAERGKDVARFDHMNGVSILNKAGILLNGKSPEPP